MAKKDKALPDAFAPIDQRAKLYREMRDQLVSLVNDYDRELQALNLRYVSGIRATTLALASLEKQLGAEIEKVPQLFEKPRSITLHGIKVGLQKQKGSIEFDDEEKLIERIRKVDEKDTLSVPPAVLIKSKEYVSKEGLQMLRAEELKKLGVRVVADTDKPVIKPADTTIDKLVQRILEQRDAA